jgi:hypothetical protein
VGKPTKDHLGDLGIDGKIIIITTLILSKYDAMEENEKSGSGYGQAAHSCEHEHENSESVISAENDSNFLKKDSVLRSYSRACHHDWQQVLRAFRLPQRCS